MDRTSNPLTKRLMILFTWPNTFLSTGAGNADILEDQVTKRSLYHIELVAGFYIVVKIVPKKNLGTVLKLMESKMNTSKNGSIQILTSICIKIFSIRTLQE